MAAEDYFDEFEPDEYELEDVTCKRCGERHLEWDYEINRVNHVDYKSRWFLVDGRGNEHQCPPASADEFEVVANG